jgi:replication factor C subunit 3/5
MNISVPWMEKYRPTNFNNIVLDNINKQIFNNILSSGNFPNLLFYGPPGTGKTTTIINLVNAYQEKFEIKNKNLMIHLNASDDRGIDIIRNQINYFVNSNPLFQSGVKFVILDEVDYMTKTAQQALKYLLQNYSNTVRYCLICNYVSKIDEGLQNEFIKLRFNQLPRDDILIFLKNISDQENLNLSENSLLCIQKIYKSDIRSMINFMQSNQDNLYHNLDIIDNTIWEDLTQLIKNKTSLEVLHNFIQNISIKYNIDKKNALKDYLNFIIRYKNQYITNKFLSIVENAIHSPDCKNTYFVNYLLSKLIIVFNDDTSDLAPSPGPDTSHNK